MASVYKTTTQRLYNRMIASMGVENLRIPEIYVRFFKHGDSIPDEAASYRIDEETLMCCQAARYASLGHPVLLTKDNIGCLAAAISLGLVDQNRSTPLDRPRIYTSLMREQSGLGSDFVPPSPRDFTSGEVYACRAAGKPRFGLFGPDDSGRMKGRGDSQKGRGGYGGHPAAGDEGCLFL